MAKKRNIRNKKPKTARKPFMKQDINSKLDQIIVLQKKLLKEDHKIEKEELMLEEEEKKTEKEEIKETKELKKIEKGLESREKKEEEELLKLKSLEEEIKREVGTHPLRKVGFKDIVKGFVGAFIGLVVHYTFFYGIKIAENLDFTRSTLLFVLSFFVGIMFIYTTGFRKIKDPKVLMFIPVRLIILYVISVIMSVLVLYLFYPKFGHDFMESYKMVSVVLLAAIVGACTADLIGKE